MVLVPPTTHTANPKSAVLTAQTEVQSAVALLEKCLFLRTCELLDRVTIAAKDASGKVKWVTLNPTYHTILVRTAIGAIKASGTSHSVASIKEALFIFLLSIINGKQQADFFTQPEGERKTNRDACEYKRPARKPTTVAVSPLAPPPTPPSVSPPQPLNPDPTPPPTTPLPLDNNNSKLHCSGAQDSFTQAFLENFRKYEWSKHTQTKDNDARNSSPTVRRASQEAHPQDMKRALDDETKLDKSLKLGYNHNANPRHAAQKQM